MPRTINEGTGDGAAVRIDGNALEFTLDTPLREVVTIGWQQVPTAIQDYSGMNDRQILRAIMKRLHNNIAKQLAGY